MQHRSYEQHLRVEQQVAPQQGSEDEGPVGVRPEPWLGELLNQLVSRSRDRGGWNVDIDALCLDPSAVGAPLAPQELQEASNLLFELRRNALSDEKSKAILPRQPTLGLVRPR